jgi:hypothetical protein
LERRIFSKAQNIPANNVAFVLFILKGRYSHAHTCTPVNNVALYFAFGNLRGAGGIDPNAFIPHFD